MSKRKARIKSMTIKVCVYKVRCHQIGKNVTVTDVSDLVLFSGITSKESYTEEEAFQYLESIDIQAGILTGNSVKFLEWELSVVEI